MKVLHVISSGGMYGAEAVILNLSRAMNESGHCSIVGSFANEPVPNLQLHERAQAEGLESYLIPCRGQFDRGVSARIRELVVQHGVDVVHSHGYKSDVYAWFALRGTGVPYVSTCHTWYDNNLAVRLYGALDRLVLRGYSAVAAVSADVRRRLLDAGVSREKIHFIENGIDLRPFDGAWKAVKQKGENSGRLVGLIGRLATEKGVDVFLRAAALVLKEMPESRFVVAGEGPEREALERLINELGVREYVMMMGRCDETAKLYGTLDVMVSSSRHEGLPMGILEGMASGRAIIATPVGEVPAVIVDGETGVLVAVEDATALARAILRLLGDPVERLRLGTGARQLVEQRYSAQRMMTDYLRMYELAMAGDESSVRGGVQR